MKARAIWKALVMAVGLMVGLCITTAAFAMPHHASLNKVTVRQAPRSLTIFNKVRTQRAPLSPGGPNEINPQPLPPVAYPGAGVASRY